MRIAWCMVAGAEGTCLFGTEAAQTSQPRARESRKHSGSGVRSKIARSTMGSIPRLHRSKPKTSPTRACARNSMKAASWTGSIREVERAWTGSSMGRRCQTCLTLLTLFFSPGRLQPRHKSALVESANCDQDSFIRSSRSSRSNGFNRFKRSMECGSRVVSQSPNCYVE